MDRGPGDVEALVAIPHEALPLGLPAGPTVDRRRRPWSECHPHARQEAGRQSDTTRQRADRQ